MLNTLRKVKPNSITLNDQDWLSSWLSDATNLSQFGKLLGKKLQHKNHGEATVQHGNITGFLDLTNNEPVLVYSGMPQLQEQHIGSLLTLMSRVNYTTLIWITDEIQDNLISTLKWLNTVTEDRFSFFGIQTEFWCIADSLPAPVFRVQAAPQNWQSNIEINVTQTSLSELTNIPLEQTPHSETTSNHSDKPTKHETIPPPITSSIDSNNIILNSSTYTQQSQPNINNLDDNLDEKTNTTSTVNLATEVTTQELPSVLEHTPQHAITVQPDEFKDIIQENNVDNDDDYEESYNEDYDDDDDDDDDDDATSNMAMNMSLSSHDLNEEIELGVLPDLHGHQPMEILSNFWEGVNAIIEDRDGALQPTLAFPQPSITFLTEHPEHSLVAQLDPVKQQATVKLVLIGSQGNTDFLTLEHMKRIIERELSTPLYWTNRGNDADCEIMVVNNRVDLSSESTQLEAQYWIVERLEKFHEMLTRYFVFD